MPNPANSEKTVRVVDGSRDGSQQESHGQRGDTSAVLSHGAAEYTVGARTGGPGREAPCMRIEGSAL